MNMNMRNQKLMTGVLTLCLLGIIPGAGLAQSIALLTAAQQQSLRTAATQGPNQLLSTIYNLVRQTPQAAQAIVNEAARYQPAMGQSMAALANRALTELATEKRALQSRSQAIPSTQTIKTSRAASAPSATATSGLSAGGWIATGLGAGALGAVAAFGAGSGSGGSSPTPFFAEYQANWGLDSMDAASAYNRTATGAGVLVAYGDTGLDTDHPEFSGQFSDGYNALNATSGISAIEDDPTGTGHGTFVAGIIAARRNGTGVHGVAYNADLLPIKMFDNSTSATPAETAAGVSYAVSANADIWNGSYGYTTPPSIVAIEAELDAYEAAISSGMIMVFSTGNDGDPDPFFPAAMPYIQPANDGSGLYTTNTNAKNYSATASQLLAVASVDESGTISSFSNRCGVAAAWCLAAPGGAIVSTDVGGGYATGSGTSFAAPHVAGAAALLLDKYPSLTPAQVVARLLTTATKTGIYATTATYGQGLLNMTSATSFVAMPIVPLGASLSGPLVPLSASQLQLSAAFGDGLSRSLSNMTFKPVDSFDGAAIETSGADLLKEQSRSNSQTDGLRRFGQTHQTLTLDRSGTTVVNWQQVRATDQAAAQTEALVTTHFTPGSSVSVGYMNDPALGFGLMGDGTVTQNESRSHGAFLSPYLGLAQDGVNMMAQTRVGGMTLRAASFSGSAEASTSASAYGAAAELVFAPYQGSAIALQSGFVQESHSFLGSESEGAMAFGETSTSYVGVSAKLPLDGQTDLVGSYFVGQSQLDSTSQSLISGFSPVGSSAFSLGAVRRNLAVTGDRAGLMLNQPLRVNSGTANLRLPNGVDRAHQVSYNNVSAALSPTGRELDIEAFYSAPLSQRSQLNASIMYRHQPDHIASADAEVQTLVRWQAKY